MSWWVWVIIALVVICIIGFFLLGLLGILMEQLGCAGCFVWLLLIGLLVSLIPNVILPFIFTLITRAIGRQIVFDSIKEALEIDPDMNIFETIIFIFEAIFG